MNSELCEPGRQELTQKERLWCDTRGRLARNTNLNPALTRTLTLTIYAPWHIARGRLARPPPPQPRTPSATRLSEGVGLGLELRLGLGLGLGLALESGLGLESG